MILYHATPKANLDSIGKHGINPDFSQGKQSVCWVSYESETSLGNPAHAETPQGIH